MRVLRKTKLDVHPVLDEYRAAIEQARIELGHLRPALEASDDVSSAARLEEVVLSLKLIAFDMQTRMQPGPSTERLSVFRLRVIRGARSLKVSIVDRLLGGVPWW